MKILITGATGFIGTHLRRRLRKEYELVALIRPTTDTASLKNERIGTLVFDGDVKQLSENLLDQDIKGIVHLASLYLKTHKPEEVQSLVESNVLFPTQLLEASVASSVKWFLNTGTFWQHYQDKSYSPVNLYASTKQAFIDVAQYYSETSALKFITLKLSDTFGPGDTRPKIFNLWKKHAETGETLKMSAGEQLMDINYIDNVTDSFATLIRLLQSDPESLNAEYAVSNGTTYSLRELALLFEETTGKNVPIVWGAFPYREREVMKPWSLGEAVPGWSPKVSIDEGIKRTFKD